MGSVKQAVKRLVLGVARLVRPAPLLSEGQGQGLRFDAGPSNPEYETGANELPVQEVVASCLGPGAVFVDVGANVGFFSVIAARLVGSAGTVVAFEPVPKNAALIRRNAARNGFRQVTVVEKAVADREGSGRLVLAAYAGGSALDFVAPPPDACGRLDVDLVTLDGWLAERPGLRPDLVRIDVEGAELAVLQGMADTLSRLRPDVIVEVDDAQAGLAEDKVVACASFLEDHGYDVRRLPDSYPSISWHVIHLFAQARHAAST
jgi:FkbM family methyltransferase